MADIFWPVDSVAISAGFGADPAFYQTIGQRGHNGIDLKCPVGTPVYATSAGVVHAEGWGQHNNWMGNVAGIYVLLRHWWGYSGYAHLSSSVVNAGQTVAAKQLIGYSGATGLATGPHLHFETLPLSINWANGYAGRINPYNHAIYPRQSAPAPAPAPTPSVPKEDVVSKFYHLEDPTARNGGRILNPGDGLYLHTTRNVPNFNAVNCAGEIGPYSFVAHVYAEGKPGDELLLKYVWQNSGVNSAHYTERLTIGQNGQLNASRAFRRDVGAGDQVFLRLDGDPKNSGPIKITCLDSDATVWKRA